MRPRPLRPGHRHDDLSKTFERFSTAEPREEMTLDGTVGKAGLLLFVLIGTALWPWSQYSSGADPEALMTYLRVGGFGGVVVGFVCIFRPATAAVAAPMYAVLEGLALGSVSAVLESRFPGIVIQAVVLTFGVFAVLLLAYRSRVIQATENFKLGVTAATGGIFLVYLVSFIGGFFGLDMPLIHESGLIGILFSSFVVLMAAS